MSEPSETPFWIKFFIEAGIPPSISTEYAITFSDNRIKESMLMDLDKEYLKELGITVLGDIISILKHAKTYNANKSRQSLMAKSANVKQYVNSKESEGTSKKTSVAVRMLEHYVRKELPSSKTVDTGRSNLSMKRPIDEEETQNPSKRPSVFRRLGENFVSSTTQDTPKIIVTMLGKSNNRRGTDSPNSGQSVGLPDKNTTQSDEGLEYQGIFKYSQKEMEVKKKANLLKLKQSPNLSFTVSSPKASSSNIKHRIGTPVTSCKSEGIFAREFQTETATIRQKPKNAAPGSGKKDIRIFLSTGKGKDKILNESSSPLQNPQQTVLKKVIRVNKRTGKITSNSKKVAVSVNRLNQPDNL